MKIVGWMIGGFLASYAIHILFPYGISVVSGVAVLALFLLLGMLEVLIGIVLKGQKRSSKFW